MGTGVLGAHRHPSHGGVGVGVVGVQVDGRHPSHLLSEGNSRRPVHEWKGRGGCVPLPQRLSTHRVMMGCQDVTE